MPTTVIRTFGDDMLNMQELTYRYLELGTPREWNEADREFVTMYLEIVKQDGYVDLDDDSYLILDDFFEEYAEELAYEIGAVNREAEWPNNHIDWQQAAEDLKQDFTSLKIGPYDYWRSN